ncbi:MAG: GntR family transcriptional regulator, partial [Bacteroidota bacterium]
SGLLFEGDVFQPLSIGERVQGYIKKIRPDNKIDLTLQPIGASMLAPTAELVFERLRANGGFLALHDKSSPDEIQKVLHLSKKAFKKAIGTLYKEKRILIKEDGIYLNKSR